MYYMNGINVKCNPLPGINFLLVSILALGSYVSNIP